MQCKRHSNGDVDKLPSSHRQGNREETRQDISWLLVRQSSVDSTTRVCEQGAGIAGDEFERGD